MAFPIRILTTHGRMRRAFRGGLASAALGLLAAVASAPAIAQRATAPVEARVPWAPATFRGSDGRAHLCYELHVTNFYHDTGPLRLRRVVVFADSAPSPLATLTGEDLERAMAHPGAGSGASDGATIGGGLRAIVHVWLDLPAGRAVPRAVRHRLEFDKAGGGHELVDGARVTVDTTRPVVLAPPLRRGLWLALEGPGSPRSHHWGSTLAINGHVTVPQRYAIDFFGLDSLGHAVRAGAGELSRTATTDWVGHGAEVLAVAGGVVRAARDGVVENKPLAPSPTPDALTVDGLYGNYVVLEVAPHVFAHYAHLQPGSVTARAGERVERGAVLGRVGASGNAGAPHLHFHVSNAPTFEESEGLPYTFDAYNWRGATTEAGTLDQGSRVTLESGPRVRRHRELVLDGAIVDFPALAPR